MKTKHVSNETSSIVIVAPFVQKGVLKFSAASTSFELKTKEAIHIL